MPFSRTGRRVVVTAALAAITSVGLAWAADPPKSKPPGVPTYQDSPASNSFTGLSQPSLLEAKPATKSSRMMYEANWKNVQITDKPCLFTQGDKAFIWTVKNTGNVPVEVGDEYGFTIEPGEEEFIVDSRLVLKITGDKTATVDVQASRVMTKAELTVEQQPTRAHPVPTYSPSAGENFAPRKNPGVPEFKSL